MKKTKYVNGANKQITFFKIAFLLVFEFLQVVGHFIGAALTHLQTLHFNKSIKEVVQSNRVKIKVIIIWTHINLRNKVEKLNENYHCEKYEEIFVYFLLNETMSFFLFLCTNLRHVVLVDHEIQNIEA